MKIAFDIGGVLSKYPEIFKPLILACCRSNMFHDSEEVEVYIISDMHDKSQIREMLNLNGFGNWISESDIYSADFEKYGEACKAVLLKELKIDLFFDDFPAYLAEGCPVRCLVLPDINRPYYSDSWKVPVDVGDFGRRNRVENFVQTKQEKI